MYDVVVVGQGLSGLLSAIYAKQQNKKVAIVAKGVGKVIQSTGVLDLIPGTNKGLSDWCQFFNIKNDETVKEAVSQFQSLMSKIQYPYQGKIDTPVQIVTASGHLKTTALYPLTIQPAPISGNVVVVGLKEVVDFQPEFLKGNLQKSRPNLNIHTMKLTLGEQSQRTITQLDAARLIDKKSVRNKMIKQIKNELQAQNIGKVDNYIFPSCLGIYQWQEIIGQLENELGAKITEAPGLPPNSTAIRLYEVLRKEALKLGIRFYLDSDVNGCSLSTNKVESLTINTNRKINGRHFIIATGGILGGGLEVTMTGLKETTLQRDVDHTGAYVQLPSNVLPVGAALGTAFTNIGITGGIYSIVSSYDANLQIYQSETIGGVQHV